VADQREVILSRLAALCASVSGIAAVVRNALDVPSNARPAVIIQDGIETMLNQPETVRHSEIQRMELSPGISVYIRAGGTADPGVLLSRYRSAIVAAVLADGQLRDAVGTTGRITYHGCVVLPPDAEAKEHRLDITLEFVYAFRLDDLAA
jgi:hypothetical protein